MRREEGWRSEDEEGGEKRVEEEGGGREKADFVPEQCTDDLAQI